MLTATTGRFVLSSLTAALLFSTTGSVQAEVVLNVAYTQDLRGTNPGVDRDGNTDTVHMHVVEGLVAYAADFSIKPMLAEAWTVSDDGLTYTFKLREGVPFHNGEIMTSEHVKWSWDRFMAPETKWRCRSYFTGEDGPEVVSVETPDPLTVVYKLASRSATFLGNLARFDCGNTAVLHTESVDADGNWLEPVGTGPFKFGDIKYGRYIDLLKFEDYASRSDPQDGYAGAKEVLVDKVRLQILPEPSVSKAAYLAGDIDLLSIEPADLAEMELAPDTQILSAETAVWDTLLINTDDPVLQDKRIRQAMAQAIDREQIMAIVSEGRGRANPSPLPPVSSFFTDAEWEQLPFDPEKAKALLDEAGYDGQPIELLTNKRSGAYYERALIAQSMLKEAGINAELKVLEWGTQLDAYTSGEYQMQSFSYSPRLDPALSFEMITGEQSRKVWNSPEAIALLDQAMVVSDKVERQGIIDELHRRFIDEVPAIGIGHRVEFYAIRDSIDGFKPWGAGKQIFWGVGPK
ncbi:ABC transporter substrate-binding protein [Paracoccus alkanivorans]|uniref:ABC transporter substrate-binding protein n=1 Tax=Paracoccus alkanivorans TaxID=2116655 RepID=A0A3M0LX38_9RHOB|nr:ABC transporter substrate-binding protein [Paracoccus alkanivorans]RMC29916.1 ABC transporter substrate-binding protein [Paracoccus alkanivorans]